MKPKYCAHLPRTNPHALTRDTFYLTFNFVFGTRSIQADSRPRHPHPAPQPVRACNAPVPSVVIPHCFLSFVEGRAMFGIVIHVPEYAFGNQPDSAVGAVCSHYEVERRRNFFSVTCETQPHADIVKIAGHVWYAEL